MVVSAGGIIHAIATELHHETPEQVTAWIDAIGDTQSTSATAGGAA